ncbi:hypothetical protein C0991_006362 [Blastosporella zonata]|nr:hypothetical protein C0991_006362 [Blastosporella zonata]
MSQTDATIPEKDDSSSTQGIRRRPNVALEIEKDTPGSRSDENGEAGDVEKKRYEWKTPGFLQWIPANFKRTKLKAAFRCAVAAWIALVLFVIPPVQRFFGQLFSLPNSNVDISITTSVLFPFPYYAVGKIVVLPLAFHSAIALLTSIFVFPITISAHFTNSLSAVLSPLVTALDHHTTILATPTGDPAFPATAELVSKTVSQADGALTPLAAAARLLRSDLIYGRFSPEDFVPFHDLARRAAVRANGMGVYFSLVDPTRPRFPITPAPSMPGTPALSRQPSIDGHDGITMKKTWISHTPSHPSSPTHSRQGSHVNLSKHVHHGLLHFHPGRHRHENAVGVFESQRYMNLEATRMNDPYAEIYTAQMVDNLNECCGGLLDGCRKGLSTVQGWLGGVRSGRIRFLFKTREAKEEWAKQLAEHQKIRDELFSLIERFREEGRHHVLEPYRASFQPNQEQQHEHDPPAHRHLFQAYVYQYHLVQFAWIILEMLDEMVRLEKERTTQRLWTPVQRLFQWNNWQLTDDNQHGEDEDPG